MIEWITILSLITLGLALIIAEIIFVPGTTLVGLVGFGFLAFGVGLGFTYFGSATGWTITGSTAVASGLILYYAFKANVWGRFSLKSTIDSKVNEGELAAVTAGVEGVALSALRPSGKAEIETRTYEVRTLGNYVEAGTKVRVIQIVSNQIIVEPVA
ncbi:MAG: NfeD family protein [Cytophagales bacterium]|nr:NfeD family protein [Cytophagales bacterium]